MYCKKCGKEAPEGETVCSACREKLRMSEYFVGFESEPAAYSPNPDAVSMERLDQIQDDMSEIMQRMDQIQDNMSEISQRLKRLDSVVKRRKPKLWPIAVLQIVVIIGCVLLLMQGRTAAERLSTVEQQIQEMNVSDLPAGDAQDNDVPENGEEVDQGTADTETSGAETSDTETSSAETSDTETSGAETSDTETSGAETSDTETSGAETSSAETSDTETSSAEADSAETDSAETGGTGIVGAEADDLVRSRQ